MLEFIDIKNFKTLRDAGFPLSGLNLFSSLNGMKKSPLIQCLLTLRQSHEFCSKNVQFGTNQDVLSNCSEPEGIKITLKGRTHPKGAVFKFVYMGSDLAPKMIVDIKNIDQISLFNTNFKYLSVCRLGPKSEHEICHYHIRELNSLGHCGEYTVHFIAVNGEKKMSIAALKHKKATSDTLLASIEGWMSEITLFDLKIRAVMGDPDDPYYSTLSFAFVQGKEITEYFKPEDAGFGLSYVLPVVTSILSSKKGDLLLLENPEAHLHPLGQSIIGKLCALAAQNGVQLIVESNSDHFLNGIRVAVRQKLVECDHVNLFFFQREINSEHDALDIIYPKLDAEGLIYIMNKVAFIL